MASFLDALFAPVRELEKGVKKATGSSGGGRRSSGSFDEVFSPSPSRSGSGSSGGGGSASAPAPNRFTSYPRGAGAPAQVRHQPVRLQPYSTPAPEPARSPALIDLLGMSREESNEAMSNKDRPSLVDMLGRDGEPKRKTLAEHRQREIDREPQEKKYRSTQVKELTWERYNALTPEQRAAVDFNTMLVESREKDLSSKYKPSPAQRKTYDKEVERIFGEEGGSDTFAPETLAVLKQVNFDGEGHDLDDFLGLKQAFGRREVKNLVDMPKLGKNVDVLSGLDVNAQRTDRHRLVAGAKNFTATIGRGREILQNFRTTAAAHRNQLNEGFGGTLNDIRVTPGFGDTPTDGSTNLHTFIRDTYANLASKKADPDETWRIFNEVVEQGPNPEREKKALLRYIDDMTRTALQHGGPTSMLTKGPQFSPEEIRKMAGLDTGGNR